MFGKLLFFFVFPKLGISYKEKKEPEGSFSYLIFSPAHLSLYFPGGNCVYFLNTLAKLTAEANPVSTAISFTTFSVLISISLACRILTLLMIKTVNSRSVFK